MTTSSPTLQPAVTVRIVVWSRLHRRLWLRVACLCEKIHPSTTVMTTPGAPTPHGLTELTTSSPLLQLTRRVTIMAWCRLHQCQWLRPRPRVACLCAETPPPSTGLTTWRARAPYQLTALLATTTSTPCCSQHWGPRPWRDPVSTNASGYARAHQSQAWRHQGPTRRTCWQHWWRQQCWRQPPAVPRCSQQWELGSSCDPVSTHVCEHGWPGSTQKRTYQWQFWRHQGPRRRTGWQLRGNTLNASQRASYEKESCVAAVGPTDLSEDEVTTPASDDLPPCTAAGEPGGVADVARQDHFTTPSRGPETRSQGKRLTHLTDSFTRVGSSRNTPRSYRQTNSIS